MYSVVLGLEVLGNPVGFIKGLKDGAIGLFYHPIQVQRQVMKISLFTTQYSAKCLYFVILYILIISDRNFCQYLLEYQFLSNVYAFSSTSLGCVSSKSVNFL